MKKKTKNKNKSIKTKLKKIPIKQKKLVNISKKSKLARNELHFNEASNSKRIAGFSKAISQKRQRVNDAL